MNYLLGAPNRLEAYSRDIDYLPLNLFNIWKMKYDDVLFVTRAWSPISCIIYRRYKRPRIFQFADGLVTESNCKKKINSVPHFLYEIIYADKLFVRQPKESLPSFINMENVESVISHNQIIDSVECKSLLLVFGNDPFVCHTEEGLAFALKKLSTQVGTSFPVFFSTSYPKVRGIVRDLFPLAKDIGAFKGQSERFRKSLMVITPTTVGYDFALQGSATVYLSGCDCPTMKKLFSSSDSIKLSENGKSVVSSVLKYTNVIKNDLDLVVQRRNLSEKMKSTGVHFRTFLRFFGDLKCLLS